MDRVVPWRGPAKFTPGGEELGKGEGRGFLVTYSAGGGGGEAREDGFLCRVVGSSFLGGICGGISRHFGSGSGLGQGAVGGGGRG